MLRKHLGNIEVEDLAVVLAIHILQVRIARDKQKGFSGEVVVESILSMVEEYKVRSKKVFLLIRLNSRLRTALNGKIILKTSERLVNVFPLRTNALLFFIGFPTLAG